MQKEKYEKNFLKLPKKGRESKYRGESSYCVDCMLVL